MYSWRLRRLIILLLLSLAGCTSLPFQWGNQLQEGTAYPQAGFSPVAPATQAVTQVPTPISPTVTAPIPQIAEGNLLRIWLPPEFDPAGNSTASKLLKDHLDAFVASNPGIRVEVRVKASDGEGGLLDSLVAANAAAPLALPDLVLLPRSLLESAALKGLLYPYNGQSDMMEGSEWFEYSRQLAQVKNKVYGIPFAGDAFVMVYHPSQVSTPPNNMESLITLGKVLLFPATDPQALFTLCLYQAEGKGLQDKQGRPFLEGDTLIRILDVYQRASQSGVMPYWLTQYSSDGQIWEAFVSGESPMATTWTSTYIKQKSSTSEDLALTSLPTLNGTPFNMATGWSWALAGQDPERRSVSIKLAEFMVEKDFLAQWSRAAGYLPPRIDALQAWQEAELREVLEKISNSAWLAPSADMISTVGPPLEQALVDVLKNQSDPQSAAQAVIQQVNQP